MLSVYVFVCFVSSVLPQDNFFIKNSQLFEGDVCNSTNGALWTCQRPANCPSAIKDLKENKRPPICSYDDKIPIICCRDSKLTHEPLNRRNSHDACERYKERCQGAIRIVRGLRRIQRQTAKFPSKWNYAAAIGGVLTASKEFPSMALIGYGEANSITWSCGGSLISDQYVLSAAHCTNPGVWVGPARWVRLGDLNIATNNDDARPEEFAIVSRINHPDYKPPVLYNDIALYKLNKVVTFNQYISPICLKHFTPYPNEKATATGWGRIGPSGPKSNHLMKVEITIIPYSVCNDLVKQEMQLPRGIDDESMICAGEMEGGKDTCQGDSGGPLMLQRLDGCIHQQIGVTSFGRLCGTERSPGVYTRVSKFIPWIESIVWP